MKTSQTAALAAALLAMIATTSPVNAQDPSIPAGWLSAFPTIVQTGTHPTLKWSIEYPKTVLDTINVDSTGAITATECLIVELRVLCASVRMSANESQMVEAWVSTSGSWGRIFAGTEQDVQPNKYVFRQELAAYKKLMIGGRYYDAGWRPFYYSGAGTPNAVVLVDGDVPPSYLPTHNESMLEAGLRPYIDSYGRVAIGPHDVLLLFELQGTDPADASYDMQDLAVLATFRACNKGHGNNLDGIDASNPGNAPFIVNDDTAIDDEANGGGSWTKWN